MGKKIGRKGGKRKAAPGFGWMLRAELVKHYPALASVTLYDEDGQRYRVHRLTKVVLDSEPCAEDEDSGLGVAVFDRSGAEIGRITPGAPGRPPVDGVSEPMPVLGESILDGLARIGAPERVGFVVVSSYDHQMRGKFRVYVADETLADRVDTYITEKRHLVLTLWREAHSKQVRSMHAGVGSTFGALTLLGLLGQAFRLSHTNAQPTVIPGLADPTPAAGLLARIQIAWAMTMTRFCRRTPETDPRGFFLDENGVPLGRMQVGTWADDGDQTHGEDDGSAPAETVAQALERLKASGVDTNRIRRIVFWTNHYHVRPQPDGPDERTLLRGQVEVIVVNPRT